MGLFGKNTLIALGSSCSLKHYKCLYSLATNIKVDAWFAVRVEVSAILMTTELFRRHAPFL